MATGHVKDKLIEHCRGGLPSEQSRAIAEHLIACPDCRVSYDEIKLTVSALSSLKPVEAPQDLWRRVEARLPSEQRSDQSFSRRFQMVLAAAAVLAAVIGLVWYLNAHKSPDQRLAQNREELTTPAPLPTTVTPEITPTPAARSGSRLPSLEVHSLDGAPLLAQSRLEGRGRLQVGEWLETDSSARAQINIADIGKVEVEPNSRIGLINTRESEHRLKLVRGRIQAQVTAPPRIFVIETPAATAVDLGCAYVLDVDESGSGLLRVTSGYVLLEDKGRESFVPAGAACETRPEGPGVPYFEKSSEMFKKALRAYSSGDRSALKSLLTSAERHDTLSLWHLLPRVNGEDRAQVYDRMAELYGPPGDCTREGLLKLDRRMLEEYRKRLAWVW